MSAISSTTVALSEFRAIASAKSEPTILPPLEIFLPFCNEPEPALNVTVEELKQSGEDLFKMIETMRQLVTANMQEGSAVNLVQESIRVAQKVQATLSPDFIRITETAGKNHLLNKDFQQASNTFFQLIQTMPNYKQGYFWHGLAALYNGEANVAIADFNQIENPSSPLLFSLLKGIAHIEVGDYTQALINLSVDSQVSHYALFLFYSAKAYVELGNFDSAKICLDCFMEINKDTADHMRQAAETLIKKTYYPKELNF